MKPCPVRYGLSALAAGATRCALRPPRQFTAFHLFSAAGLLLLFAVLLGCPMAERPPDDPPAPPAERDDEPEAVGIEADPFDIPAEPPEADPPIEDLSEEVPLDVPSPPAEEPVEQIPETEPLPDIDDPDDMTFDFPKPPEVDDTWQQPEPEPWDLGPPLVENADQLKPLDPEKPIWLDMANRRVVFVGKVCQREVPLELFACIRYTKEHEAIVVADVKALTVHAGLLAVGAEPGEPVQFHPEYVPASGTEIEVTVYWKDDDGQVQTARAQDWIRNTETNEAMTEPWVFAGSGFWVDPSGEKVYQAEAGDLICVANFATATLDVPVESSQANHLLSYTAYTERIPPLETPVTVVLHPKLQPETEEAAQEPVDEPAEDVTEEAAEEPAEDVTEEAAEEPAEDVAEEPADETAE